MKTKTTKLPGVNCDGKIGFENRAPRPVLIQNSKRKIQNIFAFTLIELLVVISVISVLAAFTFPVLKSVKKQQYTKNVQAEMSLLETALENYKAKYGFYPPSNQITPTNSYSPLDRSEFSQLYYELAGTTNNGTYFITIDGSSQIAVGVVSTAYGVGGFINCSKGSGEDASSAKNFLVNLSSKQINIYVTNNLIDTTELITSVGGPDQNYQPLSLAGQNVSGVNPFRYICPGINNPNSYDLWVQLSIGSSFSGVNNFTTPKKYLICNWSKNIPINSPLP